MTFKAPFQPRLFYAILQLHGNQWKVSHLQQIILHNTCIVTDLDGYLILCLGFFSE